MPTLGVTGILIIVVGLLIRILPLMLLGGAAWYFLARSTTGRAIMERARRDVMEIPDAVAVELGLMRQEMAEMQERLDFAERALSQIRNTEPIRPPFPAGRTPTPPEPMPVG